VIAALLEGVTKKYHDVVAVDHLHLSIQKGEVYGLLGRNGAGKTTTMEMMEGLRRPDQGSVRVLGEDPAAPRSRVKERIGVQLQTSALYDKLRVEETVELFRALYTRSLPTAELLHRFSLEAKRKAFVRDLSGGLKQRLALALALVNDPEVVFLDELSTGLDPHARQDLWDSVRQLKAEGRTVVLTTHYMEEAEVLCDRVGVLINGRLEREGAPGELVKAAGLRNLEELFLTITGRGQLA
jgi:ABC-2 type transport system ATP-binding protein